MISLNYRRYLCVSESNLRLQKNLYSNFSFTEFSWRKARNDLRLDINFHIKNFSRRLGSLKKCNSVEEHSAKILRSWSQQIEYITTYRIRRTFQIFNVYKKWWGSLAECFTIQRFINEVSRKRLYFTACLAPLFEWRNERIPQEELSSLLCELNKVKEDAKKETEYPTTVPSSDVENSESIDSLCQCIRCQHAKDDDWSLIFESNTLKIWRKEHLNYQHQGLYVYKVYGHFNDVTANDFFRVQIDTEFRKEWDPNSVKLEIVDSDQDTNSDVLYWEFLFPRMFYNRDYVCNRRYEIDKDKKFMAVVSQSVEHPKCPKRPPIHRVQEYWSHIIMRPTGDSPDDPGVEFTIMYFDNPELLVPEYISVWYTFNGMPDYIDQQRKAALKLAARRTMREKIKEKVEKDEVRAKVLSKDPDWNPQDSQGPPKRVLLF